MARAMAVGSAGGLAKTATLGLMGCGLQEPSPDQKEGRGHHRRRQVRQRSSPRGPDLPPLSSVSPYLGVVPLMGMVPQGSSAPDLLLVTQVLGIHYFTSQPFPAWHCYGPASVYWEEGWG